MISVSKDRYCHSSYYLVFGQSRVYSYEWLRFVYDIIQQSATLLPLLILNCRLFLCLSNYTLTECFFAPVIVKTPVALHLAIKLWWIKGASWGLHITEKSGSHVCWSMSELDSWYQVVLFTMSVNCGLWSFKQIHCQSPRGGYHRVPSAAPWPCPHSSAVRI